MTSTSISLAAGSSHKGKHVLLVDINSQANSSKVLLQSYPEITKDPTIYATSLERSLLCAYVLRDPDAPDEV